jgi:hypothetical protein
MKARLVHSLHVLLSNNVIGSKQYKSRYIGFRSELQTIRHLQLLGRNVVEGAYIIPLKDGAEVFSSGSILFSVQRHFDPELSKRLFDCFSKLGLEKLFLVLLGNEAMNWQSGPINGFEEEVLIPQCQLFVYDSKNSAFESAGDDLSVISENFRQKPRRSPLEKINVKLETQFKEELSEFTEQELSTLYVERFIFDGLIGFGRERGIPTDIDGIMVDGNELVLLEIKEKDLSKRHPVGFGMDVRRIEQLKNICRRTSLRLELIVRQVKNQTSREFLDYQRIDFQDFYQHTSGTKEIEGGHGMRSETSSNPTQICPVEYFEKIM